MLPRWADLASVLVVLVGVFAPSTSAGSLRWRYPSNIGDVSRNLALEAVTDRLNKLTNLSADPCDDFYEFACGGAKWQQADESIPSKLGDIVDARLDLLITSDPNEKSQTNGLKLIRNLFNSCNSFEKTRDKNLASFQQLLAKLGGIPALGERSGWIEGNQTSWTDLAVQLRRLGLQTDLFYRLDVRQNHLNRSKSAIYISLADSHSRGNYERLVTKFLISDMTEAEADRFKKHLKATEEFRHELANIFNQFRAETPELANERERFDTSTGVMFPPYNYLGSDEFQSMQIKSLKLLVPQLDWAGFLSEMFQYPISSEVEIFVHKPEGFVVVQKFIESSSSSEILRNFMMLEAINDVIYPTLEYNIDSDACIRLIESDLGLVLSAEYVRNYLSPETRASATIMVDYLRRELEIMIREADWISDMAKQGALAKTDTMILHVGYPDELLNESLVHSGLELEPADLLANTLNLNSWRSRAESQMLEQPFGSLSWHAFDRGTKINAFYRLVFNSINILPTIMQDFMYNNHQPNYVNFAALGSIVGHEISHAFDSNCIKYDCHGNHYCWWDPKTGAEYLRRSECFELQYNGSQVFGDYFWLNGSLTLGENIADNIGAKIARRAYQSWLADQPADREEPLLAGSLAKYNQSQLYWTSMAQFYCEKREFLYKDDEHSPNRLRVDITLSNQAEFAEAFQCPLGSRMNPKDKCTMW